MESLAGVSDHDALPDWKISRNCAQGRNQWRFVDQLKSNLRAVFADFKLGAMRGEGPRLIVELPDEIDEEVVAERAALFFGLQNFSMSRPVAARYRSDQTRGGRDRARASERQ